MKEFTEDFKKRHREFHKANSLGMKNSGVRLIKKEQSIQVNQLKAGQIAVIVGWANLNSIGVIIQRANNHLFVIGETESITDFFLRDWSDIYQVRVLTKGELIEIK